MLVFWKARLTILAVPKTGTTALEVALGRKADLVVRDPPQIKHAPLYRYNRFFRPLFEKQGAPDMETLAVMREPISWLSSWYRYRSRDFMAGKPNFTGDMSFDSFVEGYLTDPQPGFARVGSQAKFLEQRRNGCAVHHLFRYDDQAGLLSFLSERLGEDVTTDTVNASPGKNVSLSDGVARALRTQYAEDFALYEAIPDNGLHLST